MSKTLEMVFKDVAGKSKTISIAEPRDEITATEVTAVMENMINARSFVSANGDLAEVDSIKIRTVEELA